MRTKHKYFGIITARAGSKGIKRKNMQLIANKPMIKYTFEAALNATRLDYVIVSTDDPGIITFAKNFDINVPFVRPKHLAADNSSHVDVVIHALDWYVEQYQAQPKNIVLLQPTSPFRTAKDIDNAIIQFESSDKDSLISVCEVTQHPSDCITITKENKLEKIPLEKDEGYNGRQGFKTVYYINGAIYIISTEKFLSEKIFFDTESEYIVLPKSHSINIDDIFDLELARAISIYSRSVENSYFDS